MNLRTANFGILEYTSYRIQLRNSSHTWLLMWENHTQGAFLTVKWATSFPRSVPEWVSQVYVARGREWDVPV